MDLRAAKNIEDIYSLAPMQAGILFHDLLSSGPERPYIQQVLWRMDPTAHLPALRRAWEHVLARHPILRTFVVWEGRTEPIQIVCREATLPWCEIDWSGVPQAEHYIDARKPSGRGPGRRIVLTRAPLMRLCAIRLPHGGTQLVWTFHHLLIDGWCLGLLLAEALDAYDAFRQDRHVPMVRGPALSPLHRLAGASRRSEGSCVLDGIAHGFTRRDTDPRKPAGRGRHGATRRCSARATCRNPGRVCAVRATKNNRERSRAGGMGDSC